MVETCVTFLRELRMAARSLARAKTLSITVIVTLALGIGANTAIFSLLSSVLLRPLVNRDESRLIYIRQSANGGNAWFSMPEIRDITSRVKTLNQWGDFSVIGFTMAGLGEPRSVRAGVVGGSYFQTMGLRPVLGRLLDSNDDGPNAAGAAVLTYRFWSTALNRDPSVLGKTVRLSSFVDTRSATVIGVLEPCVPYPQDTEIISNIVTSSHHLSATMVAARIHRMTDLFARLAPGAGLETARAELQSAYANMKRENPAAYPLKADFHVSAVRLRDELTSPARTMLLVLMVASVLVFVIACSNVVNLILARSVRRQNELGVRAALGASAMHLRRILLAESLLLSLAGAGLGVALADPLVTVIGRYASRFSVRALDVTLDASMLWVGAALAVVSAVLLAFVPRLPSSGGVQSFGLAAGGPRATSAASRKLKVFAVVQVAASFLLVTAAAGAVTTLLSLESLKTRFETRKVLAINVPVIRNGRTAGQVVEYYREAIAQIREFPGVVNVAQSTVVPWRASGMSLQFTRDGHDAGAEEQPARARFEVVSPGFFATLGLPLLAGRDFTDTDRAGSGPVAIVSESVAQRAFPNGDALGHYLVWTDPMLQFAPGDSAGRRRIVGVVPDLNNATLTRGTTMAIYHPAAQEPLKIGGRLLVQTSSDPYSLVQPITRVLQKLLRDQPVEQARTLADIRAEVLSPQRLDAMVSGVFAGVSLLIAIVGAAGVLAFSVSARAREFGIRLAVGSVPRQLLVGVIAEGAAVATAGLAAGFAGGYWLAQLAGRFVGGIKLPGIESVVGAALVLLLAAIIASALPAVRAARIDVIQALRTE